MKFPVNICPGCGLDLTTAEPAEIKNPGEVALVGTCPQCSAPFFMVEDSASLLDVPEAEPVADKPKKGKPELEPSNEPEPEASESSLEPETPPEE